MICASSRRVDSWAPPTNSSTAIITECRRTQPGQNWQVDQCFENVLAGDGACMRALPVWIAPIH
eukprot:1162018-Pelagomonas_calceolata.AAC.13